MVKIGVLLYYCFANIETIGQYGGIYETCV